MIVLIWVSSLETTQGFLMIYIILDKIDVMSIPIWFNLTHSVELVEIISKVDYNLILID